MPLNTKVTNGYNNDTGKAALNGVNPYSAEGDKPENQTRYMESSRNQINKSLTGINSHVVYSAKIAQALAPYCDDEITPYEVISRWRFVNFYYQPADYDTGRVWKIGSDAFNNGFPPAILVELTRNVGNEIRCEDGSMFYSTESQNGKYTPVKIKEVKNKVYKRQRRVW